MSPDQVDPRLEVPFTGTIGRTVEESSPWWPVAPRSDGPNVVVVVLDDVGFAQLGCYGSSIATPRMDALAQSGLRYTNFHVTGLCSTTRASLLTGRNHHSVGVGFLAAFDTGYPSYRGAVSIQAATLAEVLRDAGYGTHAVGKWHLTPPPHMSPAGPFHQWPTQRGFDRYYGFLWGEEDQWAPELWYDQHRVDPPSDASYHLSEDLVGKAEEFLSDHISARPDDPFFCYLAFGACHAPHQAPREFIDKYAGAFDHGWDVERERVLARQIALGIVPQDTVLAPRNPGVAPWADLTADQQRVYARMQEVYAGFMEHTDAQVGALVDYLARYDKLDDTVIMVLSDNGASGEGGEHGTANEYRWFLRLPDTLEDSIAAYDELGGPMAHNHYPAGWAQAGNTPGKFYKRYTYGGGVRAPLVVHWPNGLSTPSGSRSQFHHVIDVVPTVLDVCGASAPSTYRGVEQLTMHGTSMAYTFDDPDAPSRRTLQYFETAGYRGIVADRWKAVASHNPGDDFDLDHWELYRLDSDCSESTDVSAEHPERAEEMRRLWWQEAEKYGVLPLDDRMQSRMAALDPDTDQLRYVLLPGSRSLHKVVGPNFAERSFRIAANVDSMTVADEGVLLAWGRRAAGFSFFVKRGRLMFDYNLAGRHTLVSADMSPGTGPATLELRLVAAGRERPATAQLLVDGTVMGEGDLPRPVPGGMGCLSTQCGHNSPSPVSAEYAAPFAFTGDLDRVVIDLEPAGRDTSGTDWTAELLRE